MKIAEYRDLISSVSDQLASVASAATEAEKEGECHILARLADELKQADCQRASTYDKAKAARVAEKARRTACDFLMYYHDNQRIEAQYLGTPW